MAGVDIPLCNECRHCRTKYVPVPEPAQYATALRTECIWRCVAMSGMPNPINGEPIVDSDCGWMRLGCDCGREGKLFEPIGGHQQ